MPITQRMKQRTIAIPVGGTVALVGTYQGAGGREGVLNGGIAARLNLQNSIAEALTVQVYVEATRGATPVLQSTTYTLPSLGTLSIKLGNDIADLAAYALSIRTSSTLGGNVTADWTVVR